MAKNRRKIDPAVQKRLAEASPVVDKPAVKSKRSSIPRAMQGIVLLPVADQKLALSQQTWPRS